MTKEMIEEMKACGLTMADIRTMIAIDFEEDVTELDYLLAQVA